MAPSVPSILLLGAEIAADIGPGLAKAAIAIRVDGVLRDLSLPISEDCEAALVTRKDEEALELIRHDCAYIMAEAVLELYPEIHVTIGPPSKTASITTSSASSISRQMIWKRSKVDVRNRQP